MNRMVYHLLKSNRQAINSNVNSKGRKVKLRASKSGDKVYKHKEHTTMAIIESVLN